MGRERKKDYARALLGSEQRKLRRRLRSVALWSVVNTAAATYGERHMGRNYLRARLEDLCARPEEAIREMYCFLGSPQADVAAAVTEIKRPESLGRWKTQAAAEVLEISRVGRAGLERFGYWHGEL